MTCENTVSRWTARGTEVPVDCGRTGFHGELVLCEKCESMNMREQILTNSDEPEDAGWTDY
jgi:hypothetical protein